MPGLSAALIASERGEAKVTLLPVLDGVPDACLRRAEKLGLAGDIAPCDILDVEPATVVIGDPGGIATPDMQRCRPRCCS